VTNDQLQVHWKTVTDTLVASIRFQGSYGEIGDRFAQLEGVVGTRPESERIVVYHGGGTIEVCLPVDRPVSSGDISSRVLEGLDMMCTTFRGRYGSEEVGRELNQRFGAMWRYTIEHHIGVSEDPWREVHLGDDPEDTGAYTAELQVPMLLPLWLERFHGSLGKFAGENVRRDVLAGSENLTSSSDTNDRSPGSKARWSVWTPPFRTRKRVARSSAAARMSIPQRRPRS